MKATGINWAAYGFEAGSKNVLKGVNKGYNLDTLDNVVKMTYGYGSSYSGNDKTSAGAEAYSILY